MERLIACFRREENALYSDMRMLRDNCALFDVTLSETNGFLFACGPVGSIMVLIGQMQKDGYETLCSVEGYSAHTATLVGLV